MNRLASLRDTCLIVLSGVALASQSGVKLAIVNESPSLPEGLYLRAPFARPGHGDVVALRPPPAAKAYLSDRGMPPGVLLLKRVAALEGEEVCATDRQVTTPVRTVAVRPQDRRGRDLPSWDGCVRLARGELFVLGDTDASFDSRYFGPVRRDALAGVFKAAVTW